MSAEAAELAPEAEVAVVIETRQRPVLLRLVPPPPPPDPEAPEPPDPYELLVQVVADIVLEDVTGYPRGPRL